MIPARRRARLRAEWLGTQPSRAAASRTLLRVGSEKPRPSCMTRDTVAVENPLSRATS